MPPPKKKELSAGEKVAQAIALAGGNFVDTYYGLTEGTGQQAASLLRDPDKELAQDRQGFLLEQEELKNRLTQTLALRADERAEAESASLIKSRDDTSKFNRDSLNAQMGHWGSQIKLALAQMGQSAGQHSDNLAARLQEISNAYEVGKAQVSVAERNATTSERQASVAEQRANIDEIKAYTENQVTMAQLNALGKVEESNEKLATTIGAETNDKIAVELARAGRIDEAMDRVNGKPTDWTKMAKAYVANSPKYSAALLKAGGDKEAEGKVYSQALERIKADLMSPTPIEGKGANVVLDATEELFPYLIRKRNPRAEGIDYKKAQADFFKPHPDTYKPSINKKTDQIEFLKYNFEQMGGADTFMNMAEAHIIDRYIVNNLMGWVPDFTRDQIYNYLLTGQEEGNLRPKPVPLSELGKRLGAGVGGFNF